MVIRLLLILVLLCSFTSNALNRLSATIDRNPVMANESFILTIEADDKLSSSLLDLSHLHQQFTVSSTNTSQQTQIINNSVTHTTRWTVLLISKVPGQYTIPAFTINNVSSDPIMVEVIKASKQNNSQTKDVFIETSVDRSSVYLQSTIQYTTKIYLAVDIQRGSLSEPSMDNANIQQIGKDEELSEIRNGNRYRVIKRLYAITPQRSGDYQISAPVFNADIVVSQRRSFFSGFNNTKPISLVGDEIDITVNPIPDNYSGQWLPSDFVVLNEEWQPANGPYKVGDPITRIITLAAVGVSEEQLPEIEASYPSEVKTYPDQSTLNSANRQGQLIAQRKDSIALVPSKPGQLTLPEVKIPWWNTRINKMEFATLPAKTITIEASENTPITTVPAQVTAPISADLPPAAVQTEIQEVQVNSYLTWGFLAAWLTTLLLWFIHVRVIRNADASQPSGNTNGATNGSTHWKHFASACKNNDPKTADQELLRWGRARWPQQSFTSTQELARFLNSQEVIEQVNQLQAHMYAGQQSKWQGQALAKAVSQNKTPQTSEPSQGLNPLHPN